MSACRISYDQDGVASVTNERGLPSALYQRVLEITEDQDVAINVWSAALHPDSGLNGEFTSTDSLLSFMDSHISTVVKLNPEEIALTSEVMRRNGFETLSEFNSELVKLFKPNGFIEMPITDNTGKNLFSQDDLRNINLIEVNNLMQRIEGHLARVGEVYTAPYNQKELFIDTSRKNIFGMSEKMSIAEVNNDIMKNINDFTNETDIENAIKSSPFTEIIEKFNTDEEYRRNLIDELKDYRRLPTVSIIAGKLSAENNTHYTTVKNTIASNLTTTSIDAEMEYLASINDFIWKNNQDIVKGVLQEIEKELALMGIDIIGISNHTSSKEVVIDILNEVSLMVRQPNHRNIKAFTDKFQQLVPQKQSSIVRLLDEHLEGLNIVHLESNNSEVDLFNSFGLIKVGEDLYHKVDEKADINTIMDYLVKEYAQGNFELPQEFVITRDMENKVGLLKDLNTYISSRTEMEGLVNKQLYTAYKVTFGHSEFMENMSEVETLPAITTNEQYLKTQFVSDFYKYMLTEKAKDSNIYNNVLSHFSITDKDISLTGKPISIEGLRYEQELKDYISLKKGSKMRYLIDEVITEPVYEDMAVINFPNIIKEFTGEHMMHGNHVVIPNTSENYIKISGELYRKSATNENFDVFTKITTPSNNIYYTNSTNFKFDKSEAISALDLHQELITPEEFNPEQSKVGESIFERNKNIGDYSTILDSSLKVVNLYNQNEKSEIVNNIDECGG